MNQLLQFEGSAVISMSLQEVIPPATPIPLHDFLERERKREDVSNAAFLLYQQ